MAFQDDLREGFLAIKHVAVGWDDLLTQAMFGLVTREHIVWFSEPGRAKSMTARLIFQLFPDAHTFSKQITRDTMPDDLIGSEIPKEYMDTGRQVFNLDGGICDVEFAFLDEFFDGGDPLVRALHTVLNERRFETKDQPPVDVPLHTAIMTTNFHRDTAATAAVLDRIMCKAYVPRVDGLVDSTRMYTTYLDTHGSHLTLPRLSYVDLKEFADTIDAPDGVYVSPAIKLMHAYLIQAYIDRRIAEAQVNADPNNPDTLVLPTEVTPRSEAKLHDFSRACALLSGRREVQFSDLAALRYGLVTIGDGSSDDRIWAEVCEEMLPKRKRDEGRLEDLAAIAEALADIKANRDANTDIQITIGGKLWYGTILDLKNLFDRIVDRGTATPAIADITDRLKTELDQINSEDDKVIRFSLEG